MTTRQQADLLGQELRKANITCVEVNYGLLRDNYAFVDIFPDAGEPIYIIIEAFKKRGCDRIRVAIRCGEEFRDTRYQAFDLEQNARKAVARIKNILGSQSRKAV